MYGPWLQKNLRVYTSAIFALNMNGRIFANECIKNNVTEPSVLLLMMGRYRNIFYTCDKQKTNSVALVRKRTIRTERPQLVGEVSANFSG
jgi:hypothetical protein